MISKNIPINEHALLNNVIFSLLNIDIYDFPALHENICKALFHVLPDTIFISMLTYNDNSKEIIYNAIYFDKIDYNANTIKNLIKDYIVLRVDTSTSGVLIKSNNNILIVDNVLSDSDYQSIKLAKYMEFQKGIFLKIRELKTKDIYGVLIIYPNKDSVVNHLFGEEEYSIILSLVENIISNAKRIREHKLLLSILDAAKKVKKDLSSFLHKCVSIISDELYVKGCSIFIVDPIDNIIKLKATLGVKPGPLFEYKLKEWKNADVKYKMGEGITGKIAETNKMVVMHYRNIKESMWIEKNISNTFLGMPISKIDEDKAIGVIRCATKPNILSDTHIEAFNHEDIELLKYISNLLSVFIEIAFFQENQRQLITKMPHELRASLNNILNNCVYLSKKPAIRNILADNFEEFHFIIDEAQLSMNTINSISVFEDDYDNYEYLLSDITLEIEKTVKIFGRRAAIEKNITFSIDKRTNIGLIYVDSYRIQLVIHNLIVNALKYGFKDTKVTICTDISSDNKYYQISVSNHGLPIKEKDKQDIFLNGFRAIEAISIDPNGKGFGLALVKNILDGHDSKIAVTNLNNPVTFMVSFPIYLNNEIPIIKRNDE
jgi:signal transduction histidine kinase